MNNTIVISIAAFVAMSTCSFAEGHSQQNAQAPSGSVQAAAPVNRPDKPKLTPEQKKELKKKLEIRRGGPKIARPGTLKGKIAVVNAQTSAPKSWIDEAVEYLRKETNFEIELVEGQFSFPNPKVVGGATLYVIDDASMPRVLAATEDRWTMMNVSPLKRSKTQFFEARVKKEVSRAFAMLCGGMTSNYGISLVGTVTKSEDLDVFPNGKLPIDVLMRMEPYMAGLGVAPAKLVPYRIACQEGWAPQPTNEIQRAVWDEVHAIPDKPITIEYDPKRDK